MQTNLLTPLKASLHPKVGMRSMETKKVFLLVRGSIMLVLNMERVIEAPPRFLYQMMGVNLQYVMIYPFLSCLFFSSWKDSWTSVFIDESQEMKLPVLSSSAATTFSFALPSSSQPSISKMDNADPQVSPSLVQSSGYLEEGLIFTPPSSGGYGRVLDNGEDGLLDGYSDGDDAMALGGYNESAEFAHISATQKLSFSPPPPTSLSGGGLPLSSQLPQTPFSFPQTSIISSTRNERPLSHPSSSFEGEGPFDTSLTQSTGYESSDALDQQQEDLSGALNSYTDASPYQNDGDLPSQVAPPHLTSSLPLSLTPLLP